MTLIEAFGLAGVSEIEGMNLLQENGVVSDNCVMSEDVSEPDLSRAMEWIKAGIVFDY